MAAPNIFDQFDGTPQAPPPGEPNIFDQFDKKPDYFAKLGPRGDALASQPSGMSAILHAYGQGVADSWGVQPLGLSDQSIQWLRDNGIFNNYQKGHATFWKTANEALIRDAAFLGDLVTRAGVALTYGGIKGIAETPGVPALAQAPAAVATAAMEASPEGGLIRGLRLPPALSHLAEARSAKIIGPGGEAAWKGTLPEEPGLPPRPLVEPEELGIRPEPERLPSVGVSAEEMAADVHTRARRLQPELFAEYDALSERRDTYRQWLADLGAMRDQGSSPEIEALDNQIQQLRTARLEAEPRVRPEMADQITALEEKRQGLVAALPETGDTQQMAFIRSGLLEADYRMRDISPQVSEAYHRASAGEGAIPLTPAETAATPVPEAPAPASPAMTVQPEPVLRPIPVSIAGDVARQLVAVGRPQEEADAAGVLVAARYEARAAAFGGAKGTGPELYAAEAPLISRGARATQRRGNFKTSIGDAAATIRLFANADASTFIHEAAHGWLEDMVKDAADERAPAQLVTDAATVRDYLKTPEGEIPRAAHEKFARSFERYMMEGHAPTAELANVFQKFRNWLLGIYQTVARLRAPITDDIRRVFDRMLTAPPGRVIAPEREPSGTFADLHAADAEHTPPEQAIGVADTIAAERDRVAGLATPEEIDVRRRDRQATAEVDGFERRNRISGAGGVEPGPGPAAGAGAAEPGAVGAVGAKAAPEGAGVAPGAEPAAGTGRTAPAGDRLLDKAGNIRLDNIETPEDIKQAMRDSADRNDDFLARRRGVVSDQQREDLATLLGTTPEKVLLRGIGEAFTDSEIKFLERTLAQSASKVKELAAKALETSSDQDRLAATEALLRHDMIQGLFSQATAEAGRALRALRRSQEYWIEAPKEAGPGGIKALGDVATIIRDVTGRSFNQMDRIFRAIVSFDQAGQTSRLARDVATPGLFDKLQATVINAYLSGPFTHAGYTAAGQIFAFFREGAELPAAALASAIRRGIKGGEEGAQLGAARAAFYGHLAGLQEGIRAAWTAWKSGATELPAEVKARRAARAQPMPSSLGVIGGRLGTVLESPSRMVAALHSFNWTSFYRQSIAAQAYHAAVQEGLVQGTDTFAQRVAQLQQVPTEEMIDAASDEASGGALITRPKYNSVMGMVNRFVNYGYHVPDLHIFGKTISMGTLRPLKYIDPFTVVQGNILAQSLGRGTPLMLFSQAARDDLAGRNGALAFDLRAGKLLAGTAFMSAAMGLWYAGMLNDAGPGIGASPGEKAAFRRRNGVPHGLKVGDLTFNMMRGGNLGLQMSIAADLGRAMDHMSRGEIDQVASDLVQSFASTILEESFMRGPQEALEAVNDPQRNGARFIRGFISSAFPFSVGLAQVTHELADPYLRRARTTLDAVEAKIPGLSLGVQPLYDVWGQPVPSQGWALTYYEHVARNDPVELELDRLGIYPAMPETRIRGVVLNDAQYAELSRITGQTMKMRLDQLIGSPMWRSMPNVVQIETINAEIKAAREIGRSAITMPGAIGFPVIATALRAKEAQAGGAIRPQVHQILGAQQP